MAPMQNIKFINGHASGLLSPLSIVRGGSGSQVPTPNASVKRNMPVLDGAAVIGIAKTTLSSFKCEWGDLRQESELLEFVPKGEFYVSIYLHFCISWIENFTL